MPPNSFAEWVIGSNAATRRRSRAQRRILANLEVSTDDETGDDTVMLTLPRERKFKGKRVRFAAPKESSIRGSSEEVSTDTNTSGDGVTTDESGDEFDVDCPCRKCISNRQKLKKVKQPRKISESSTDDAESDAEIHAKHKAVKTKENKAKDKNKVPSDSSIAIDSEDDASTDSEKQKLGKKKKKKEAKKSDNNKGDGEKQQRNKSKHDDNNRKKPYDGSEPTSDTTETEKSEDLPQAKGKNKQKAGRGKTGDTGRHKSKSNDGNKKSSGDSTHCPAPEQKNNKKKGKLPPPHQPSEIRMPNLIMPIHAQVLQVEHAVETVEDPRPNAFYDVEHGIMRVYHGPSYSNPYGALYPKRVYNNKPLPVGTPHPTQNPWYSGFPHGYGTNPSHIHPAPHQAAPPSRGTETNNPWFQGWGTMNIPGAPASPKSGRIDDPSNPFFGAEIDIPTSQNPQNPFDISPSARASKTSKDREAGLNSNVVPLGTPPSKPRTSADSKLWWDTQSAPGNIRKAATSNGSKGMEQRTYNNKGAGDTYGKPYTSDDSKDVDNFLQSQKKSPSKDGSQKSGNNGGWSTNNDKNKSNEADWNVSAIRDSNNNGGWGADTGNDYNDTNNGCWGATTTDNQNSGPDWGNGNSNQNSSGGLNGNVDNNTSWGANTDNNQSNEASWGNNNGNDDKGNGNRWGNGDEDNVNASGKNDANGSQTSNRSWRSCTNNAAPPGAWPVDGGNVVGDGNWSGSAENAAAPNVSQGKPPDKPPSTAGNVACRGDWGDSTAAQSTGGFWEKEGKGEEKKVQEPMW